LFHVEQFWLDAVRAILSNLFVGSALFSAVSICVGIGSFVHPLARQNSDTKKGIKPNRVCRPQWLVGEIGESSAE
jgi:hypothetical protein